MESAITQRTEIGGTTGSSNADSLGDCIKSFAPNADDGQVIKVKENPEGKKRPAMSSIAV